MDLRKNSDFVYHGETNPDDESIHHGAVSLDEQFFMAEELSDLGLQGFRIRDAQSVMASDGNFLKEQKKNRGIIGRDYQDKIPDPFNKEAAATFWLKMSEEFPHTTYPLPYETLTQQEEAAYVKP